MSVLSGSGKASAEKAVAVLVGLYYSVLFRVEFVCLVRYGQLADQMDLAHLAAHLHLLVSAP